MDKVWRSLILIRSRYDAMTPSAQSAAVFHAGIDAIILLLLGTTIYVGLTQMAAAFFFWVPVLSVLAWWRLRQARDRWSV